MKEKLHTVKHYFLVKCSWPFLHTKGYHVTVVTSETYAIHLQRVWSLTNCFTEIESLVNFSKQKCLKEFDPRVGVQWNSAALWIFLGGGPINPQVRHQRDVIRYESKSYAWSKQQQFLSSSTTILLLQDEPTLFFPAHN